MPIPWLEATRANHALEHATITILLGRLARPVRMVGRATPGGFYLHGNVPTEELTAAVTEALARLQAGEARLAVSPLCGTNLAVAGVLAGLSSVLAFGAANRPDRWSRAVLAATGAVLLAQPLGQFVQRHITTSANLRGMRIRRILRTGRGTWTVHRVETART
jgi:hypothetical protein